MNIFQWAGIVTAAVLGAVALYIIQIMRYFDSPKWTMQGASGGVQNVRESWDKILVKSTKLWLKFNIKIQIHSDNST